MVAFSYTYMSVVTYAFWNFALFSSVSIPTGGNFHIC